MKNNPPGSDKQTSTTAAAYTGTATETGEPDARRDTGITAGARNGSNAPILRDTGLAEPRFRHEIGPDVVLTGRIHFPADARVDGRLRGEVHADTLLLIGPRAEVEARIRARHLVIEGTLTGDIIESGHVELRATARMVGSIEARSLHIAAGARFEGTTRTLPEKRPPKRTRT
jgi:cytoskeletal protein CcmA (bactofilin family)